MQEITKRASETKSRIARGTLKLVTIAFMCAPLGACMGSGFGLMDSGVDSNVTTQSTGAKKNSDTASDEATIRNAVSSADLGKLKGEPLPWANTDTGSAGVVSAISQTQAGELTCRDFTTTSHSFNGIAKYRGTTCLTPSGEWKLLNFEKVI